MKEKREREREGQGENERKKEKNFLSTHSISCFHSNTRTTRTLSFSSFLSASSAAALFPYILFPLLFLSPSIPPPPSLPRSLPSSLPLSVLKKREKGWDSWRQGWRNYSRRCYLAARSAQSSRDSLPSSQVSISARIPAVRTLLWGPFQSCNKAMMDSRELQWSPSTLHLTFEQVMRYNQIPVGCNISWWSAFGQKDRRSMSSLESISELKNWFPLSLGMLSSVWHTQGFEIQHPGDKHKSNRWTESCWFTSDIDCDVTSSTLM